MEELIKQVSDKTGLSAEHAKLAVDTVVTFLKSKLPAPLASQVDAVLGGGAAGALGASLGSAGDLAKGALGGLFGGK